MNRIAVIQKSLSAFRCGLLGFLPVIGLMPSINGLLIWFRIRRHYRDWNPAAAYLKYGALFALIGLANSGLALLVIGLAITNSLIG